MNLIKKFLRLVVKENKKDLSFPINFKIIRELFKNRLQAYSYCVDSNFYKQREKESKITHAERVLGSKEKVIELGLRFSIFENDEIFLEECLTYFFIYKKMPTKAMYSFEEVCSIVKEAIAERNSFLRECEEHSNAIRLRGGLEEI